MSIGLLLFMLVVASYRLTRLVVEDSFPPAQWVRDRLTGSEERQVPAMRWVPDWLAELISCRWCASVWVGGGVTLVTWLWIGLPVPLLVWALTASGAAWLLHLEDYFTR